MKMRIIKLNSEFLIKKLTRPSSLTSNLPSDTELLDIKHDLFTGQVQLLVTSQSFEDAPETYPTPEFNLIYTTTPGAADTPLSATGRASSATPLPKTEHRGAAAEKTETTASKKTKTTPRSETGMVEEEFSSDQRQLLSFSSNGNFVIIKPVKFLKEEWEDINEVVRSLGGRWVKGDIISYWEIPNR